MKPRLIIGLREFIAIGLITIGMKITDDTPVIYFKSLGNSAWMAPVISGCVVVFLMYLTINTIDRYEDQNLIDIFYLAFGKVFGAAALLILFLDLFVSMVIDTAIYSDLISTMYFTNTPVIIIYGLIILLCSIGAMMGIGAIGSLAWSIIIYLKIALFTALILSLGHGQLDFIFPLFGYGEWEIIKVSISNVSLYDEFFYFGILATLLPAKQDFRKGMWIMMIVIIVELTLSMIAFLAVFDYSSIQLLSYPWHEVIRYISIGFINNAESLFFPFWLLGLTVRFSLYMYLSAYLFGRIVNISSYKLIIPIFAVLIVFAGMIPENPAFTLPDLRRPFLKFLSIILPLLTILLWAVVKFRTRRKKQYVD